MGKDTTTIVDIISLSFDTSTWEVSFTLNWIILLILLVILLIIIAIWRGWFRQHYSIYDMEVEISGTPKTTFKVQRNTENLKIANRIYTELVTRKAAMLIEEEKDVIIEVYNSWYKLFGIVRDEIKNVPGNYLKNHDATEALIGLSTKILNDGLRPHLTTYQAKFRRWYSGAVEDSANKKLSPQEIQKKYPDYQELIESMKEVNNTLIGYAEELRVLIKGRGKTSSSSQV